MFICDEQTCREEQDEEEHTGKVKLHFQRPWIIKANISTLNPNNSINATLGFFLFAFFRTRSVQNAQFEGLRVNARKKLIRDPRLKCRDLSILSHTDKNTKHNCPVGLQGGAEQRAD